EQRGLGRKIFAEPAQPLDLMHLVRVGVWFGTRDELLFDFLDGRAGSGVLALDPSREPGAQISSAGYCREKIQMTDQTELLEVLNYSESEGCRANASAGE